MKRIAAIAVLTLALLGAFAAANALWSAHSKVQPPQLQIGAVRFGAAGEGSQMAYSQSGEAVAVRVPGAQIASVLDTQPVVFRFTAAGQAAGGSTGLKYTVKAAEASPGTVLARTTTTIYRAAAGGDCSVIPEAPEGGNINLIDAQDVLLQAPRGPAGEQLWCAAIDWVLPPDGMYVNQVWATGTTAKGGQASSYAMFNAALGFGPALEKSGTYKNLARGSGIGEDSTTARSSHGWSADIYPDPSSEPDLVLTLTPQTIH